MSRHHKSHTARVLVIDDDEVIREATTMLLEGEGFDVVAVADGKAGVDAVKTGRFDLVLMDVFMPGMDGLEATKAIRRIQPSIPVIAVSGFMLGNWRLEMPNFDTMAAEAGAVSTLYKPVRPAALLQAIEDALAPPALAVQRG